MQTAVKMQLADFLSSLKMRWSAAGQPRAIFRALVSFENICCNEYLGWRVL